MKSFDEIYNELPHYSGFTTDPTTLDDAICSMNCFFSEIAADDENNHIEAFNMLHKKFGSHAGSFIKWGHRKSTFKQYLKKVYTAINYK